MFTGIIEEVGHVVVAEKREGLLRLQIAGGTATDGVSIGDSVAVSGVCLTVVAHDRESVTVELVPETLRRGWLGAVREGTRVNLERAATLQRFFGGHYVQGHVDGVATLASVEAEGDALRVRVAPKEPALLRYVVEKGYVTLDGASLTAFALDDRSFSISLIPHTIASISLGGHPPGTVEVGSALHLEVDVVAKYVERMMGAADRGPAG